MTREQLIELRWLIKAWSEEYQEQHIIWGAVTGIIGTIIKVIDKQISEKED